MTTSSSPEPRRGLEAFASRDFRRYQLARGMVILGAEAQSVAVAWQVYSITHRAIDLGYTGLARRYRTGGAAALSVLTDEPYFQGSLRNLELASAAAPLPCLRKDFIVDEYQIVEARAHRADAILLIAAALTTAEMRHLAAVAEGFSLDVLVEVHAAEELALVLDALGERGADDIGVNNRDLKTFEVSQETSLALVERIPSSVVRVTESGIATREDIARLRQAGFDAFLIGESLMCQPDPGEALAALIEL